MELREDDDVDNPELEDEMVERKIYDLKEYVFHSPVIMEILNGVVVEGIYRETRVGSSSIVLESVSEFPLKTRTATRVPVCFSAYEIKYLHCFGVDEEIHFNKACPALSGITYKQFKEAKDLIWKSIYVPVYDCNFQKILKDIKTHDVIGIVGVGSHSDKVRYAHVDCLVIATRNQICLFDIQFTPKNFWDMGLKNILEDKKIQKVVYDSKTIADILYNRYKVRISNVFDVMAADFDIYKKYNVVHVKNCSFKTLPQLLHTYLYLPEGMFAYTEVVLAGGTHKRRPLSDKIKMCFSLAAVFLIHLRNTQNAILLKEFNPVTTDFSNILKNCSDSESYGRKEKVLLLLPDIISFVQEISHDNFQVRDANHDEKKSLKNKHTYRRLFSY